MARATLIRMQKGRGTATHEGGGVQVTYLMLQSPRSCILFLTKKKLKKGAVPKRRHCHQNRKRSIFHNRVNKINLEVWVSGLIGVTEFYNHWLFSRAKYTGGLQMTRKLRKQKGKKNITPTHRPLHTDRPNFKRGAYWSVQKVISTSSPYSGPISSTAYSHEVTSGWNTMSRCSMHRLHPKSPLLCLLWQY